MKDCFDQSGADISALKMVFLHQANEKMDEAIIKRFYGLYGTDQVPDNIMPMNISWMGNSSVATIPTLLHQVVEGQFRSEEHTSELQSLMRISYAVFCLKKKT